MRGSTFAAQKRIGQVLLLLATGLAALSTLQVAQAQNSNPCAESNLPSPVIDLIKTKFAGWRPKQTEDLDPDYQRLWLKPHRNDCPGIAVGQFESPERLTYAVLLVPQSNPSGGYKLLVFNKMPTGDVYVWKLLAHSDAGIYSGTVIETAPPGHYENYEDARISVTTKLEGFYMELIEKGAILYYGSAGRYKTLTVSA